MCKLITNQEIIDLLLERARVENPSQLASYLSEKYGVTITRQQINQFKKSDRLTLTHLILREFVQ